MTNGLRPTLKPSSNPVAAAQGDIPVITSPAVNQLEQLKRRMRQAVAEEIYEEAARLRDEISRLNRDD